MSVCRAAATREPRGKGQAAGDRIRYASCKELPGSHGEKGLRCQSRSRNCEEATASIQGKRAWAAS